LTEGTVLKTPTTLEKTNDKGHLQRR